MLTHHACVIKSRSDYQQQHRGKPQTMKTLIASVLPCFADVGAQATERISLLWCNAVSTVDR